MLMSGYLKQNTGQKEAYEYQNYMAQLEGARISVAPFRHYVRAYHPGQMTPYKTAEAMAQMFMEAVREPQQSGDSDDFFGQKLELNQDKTGLILDEIRARNSLSDGNLQRLYDDLNRVENWRLERPFPDNYKQDKTWSDLNKMEMSIRDQIRRELKDTAKDTAFNAKDLRESLLEFKVQNQKADMLKDNNSEFSIDTVVESGEMEPDGSHQYSGDFYRHKPTA